MALLGADVDLYLGSGCSYGGRCDGSLGICGGCAYVGQGGKNSQPRRKDKDTTNNNKTAIASEREKKRTTGSNNMAQIMISVWTSQDQSPFSESYVTSHEHLNQLHKEQFDFWSYNCQMINDSSSRGWSKLLGLRKVS